MKAITEDNIEQSTIEQLQSLGWESYHSSVVSPKEKIRNEKVMS